MPAIATAARKVDAVRVAAAQARHVDAEPLPQAQMSFHYPWQRFWCPRDATFLSDESGFLVDPDILPPDGSRPRPLDGWDADRCVVLLGEPGIGKTRALAQWATSRRSPRLVQLNLAIGDIGVDFQRRVFSAEWFREWREGAGDLDLALDSLDESPNIRATAKQLLDLLASLATGGLLRVRIACGTASLPPWLVGELTQILGTPPTVLELLPLRRADVRIAAEIRHIDADAFGEAISRTGVEVWATQPLTLDLLFEAYDAGFASTRTELYDRALRRLASGPPARQDPSDRTIHSGEQRLAVARRIAAFTLLSGKTTFTLGGIDTHDGPGAPVPVDALLGGHEGTAHARVEVDRSIATEVLTQTGLVTGKGPGALGFAHKSYADHLAAAWLAEHELTLPQILSVIGAGQGSTQSVAPQFEGLAAWLVGTHAEFRDAMLVRQPEVFVDADMQAIPEGMQAVAINSYLTQIAAGQVGQPSILRQLFLGARGVEVARGLRLWIGDRSRALDARATAVAIARGLRCVETRDELVNVILCTEEPVGLRTDAALALLRIGDEAGKARLRPLVFEAPAEDDRDELFGLVLSCCWPQHLRLAELLSVLRPRRQPHFYGLYWGFLGSQDAIKSIAPRDLPTVLRWLTEDPRVVAMAEDLDRFQDHVVGRAAEHLGEPGVAPALADLAVVRMRAHKAILEDRRASAEAFGDVGRRRCLIDAVAAKLPTDLHVGYTSWLRVFVHEKDFAWTLGRAAGASDRDRHAWLQLARCAFRYHDDSHWQHLTSALNSDSRWRDWLLEDWPGWLWACSLDPSEADPLREAAGLPMRGPEHMRRVREQAARRSAILQALTAAAQGEVDAWPVFCGLAERWRVAPVNDWEFWQAAEAGVREQVIDAGLVYLRSARITDDVLAVVVKDQGIPYGVIPTLLALDLVASERPEALDVLPADRWDHWLPLVVRSASAFSGKATPRLIAQGYRLTPELARNMLLRFAAQDPYPPLDAFEAVWDEALSNSLVQYLRGHPETPALGAILERLLRKNVEGVRELAVDAVRQHASGDPQDRHRSIVAAHALLGETNDAGWPVIGPVVLADPSWGVPVLIDREWERTIKLGGILSDEELTLLVGWFFDRFPPGQDKLGPSVGPPLGHIRDSLFMALKGRATPSASAGLQSLEGRFPQFPWLRQARLENESLRRQEAWARILPQDLAAMAQDQTRRRVVTSVQLVDVLRESLERLSEELRGDLTPVRFLWHASRPQRPRPGATKASAKQRRESARRTVAPAWSSKSQVTFMRPRDEEDISDWLALHLRHDLSSRSIVVNREVVVKRRTFVGGEPGQRTDIRVDATVSGTDDTVTAFLEVKGSWNVEVRLAQRTQLVARYLSQGPCTAGLYVVAWFSACPAWNDVGDQRRTRSAYSSVKVCEASLTKQAQGLCRKNPDLVLRPFVLDCTLK